MPRTTKNPQNKRFEMRISNSFIAQCNNIMKYSNDKSIAALLKRLVLEESAKQTANDIWRQIHVGNLSGSDTTYGY